MSDQMFDSPRSGKDPILTVLHELPIFGATFIAICVVLLFVTLLRLLIWPNPQYHICDERCPGITKPSANASNETAKSTSSTKTRDAKKPVQTKQDSKKAKGSEQTEQQTSSPWILLVGLVGYLAFVANCTDCKLATLDIARKAAAGCMAGCLLAVRRTRHYISSLAAWLGTRVGIA